MKGSVSSASYAFSRYLSGISVPRELHGFGMRTRTDDFLEYASEFISHGCAVTIGNNFVWVALIILIFCEIRECEVRSILQLLYNQPDGFSCQSPSASCLRNLSEIVSNLIIVSIRCVRLLYAICYQIDRVAVLDQTSSLL